MFRGIHHKIILASVSVLALMVPAHADSLEDSVLTALNTHPTVKAALAAHRAAEEQVNEQWSGYFPDFSMSAGAGRIKANNTTTRGLAVTRGEGYSWLYEGQASVTQNIFNAYETTYRVGAAEERRHSAENTVYSSRETIALRAVQAYLDLLRTTELVEAAQAYRNAIRDYKDRIAEMFREGAADEADLSQAEERMVLAENTIVDFQGQYRTAIANFKEAVGMMPPSEMVVPNPVMETVPQDVKLAVKQAVDIHPQLVAAEHNSRALGHDSDAERSTLFPRLDAEVSHLRRDRDDVIGGEEEDSRGVLRMSWDFAMGGADLARARRTVAQEQESIERQREAAREIERSVRQAYNEWDVSQRQLGLLKSRADLNRKLLETYETQFEAAQRTLLQLLLAKGQVFDAEVTLTNGEYRLLNAQYTVLASLGQLQSSLNIASAGNHEKDE